MKLSICMMVKNEEKNLERCLNSLEKLRNAVDSELIIIDTGSTDKTIEIAELYTSRVYFHEWNNSFSEMRNKTIEYASGEWIFIIDADEELVTEEQIVAFLNDKNNSKYNGVALSLRNLKNSYSSEFTTELVTPRIFKNGIGFQYEGSVHNLPIIKGELLFLNDVINHYGYIVEDAELMEKKYYRTKTLLEKELEKNPDNIYYMYQLATSYAMHGDTAEAYFTSKRAFQSFMCMEDKYQYLFVISAVSKDALNYNKLEEVVDYAKIGIGLEADFIDLYYFAATALVKLGDIEKAIYYYEMYLEKHDNFEFSPFRYNSSIQHYTLHHREEVECNLSVCYLQKNNLEKALYFSSLIVKENNLTSPYFSVALKTYVLSVLGLGNYSEILETFHKFPEFKMELIKIIESNISASTSDYKADLFETLSSVEGSYGIWNKLRSSPDLFSFDENSELGILEEIKNGNADALYYILKYSFSFSKMSSLLDDTNMMYLFNRIDERYTDFLQVTEAYLEKVTFPNDIWSLIWKKNLLKYRYIKNIHTTSATEFFTAFVDNGIEIIERKYSTEFLSDTYFQGYLNAEEQFFLVLKLFNNTQSIEYLHLALELFPEYKESIIRWTESQISLYSGAETIEMESLRLQLRSNIEILIEGGKLNDANELLSEYLTIFPNDIEMILLQSELMLVH